MYIPPNPLPMNYLFFDTETTGLPHRYDGAVSDINNWPRVVQLGFALYVGEKLVEEHCMIVHPEDFTIPDEASRVHGITQQVALKEGELITHVLATLLRYVQRADVLVAHNISFDVPVVLCELLRKNKRLPVYQGLRASKYFYQKPRFCTKEASTDFCQLPGRKGYKWPKLDELHQKLFDRPVHNAHNALSDVRATASCFFEMKRQGIIANPFPV